MTALHRPPEAAAIPARHFHFPIDCKLVDNRDVISKKPASKFLRQLVLALAVACLSFFDLPASAADSGAAGDRAGSGNLGASLPSPRVMAFYYPWYGNPATDGRYANWNHPVAVRNEAPRSFPGGDDIGSNFYPSLGCYSVNDPAVLREHMRELRQAGVGVICVSWWGPDTFTDRAMAGLFKAAEQAGILVSFHIEPFPGRNAATTRQGIAYLLSRYGSSPACFRLASQGNKPVFFVYDSYRTPADQWATILRKDGTNSIRGTELDAMVIGLWVKETEEPFMIEGGFDGFYTYFATDGFTYGSTFKNWPKLAHWARAHHKLFVPCVAPGYIDTRIRPWNGVNTRDREKGAYYDRSWAAALAVSPDLAGITSFNEWHEGTQIEPAAPKQIPAFTYLDYLPLPHDYYLDRTAYWVRQLTPASSLRPGGPPTTH
jgi:glycoprotein endo-alpha-1,2-mannosidase